MCFSSQQPKPDINSPPYKPNQIGENMTLGFKPKDGEKVILQRQPKDGDPKRDSEEDTGIDYTPGMYGGGSRVSM